MYFVVCTWRILNISFHFVWDIIYRYTMELIQLAQSSVVEVGFTQKYFFQSCIIAAQIQASCLSLVDSSFIFYSLGTVAISWYDSFNCSLHFIQVFDYRRRNYFPKCIGIILWCFSEKDV